PSHSPHWTKSGQIRLNPGIKNGNFIVRPQFPPLPHVKSFPIRVYPCPSVVQLLPKNKNYQTNPFVIFHFARKHCGLCSFLGRVAKKRTHFSRPESHCSAGCQPAVSPTTSRRPLNFSVRM